LAVGSFRLKGGNMISFQSLFESFFLALRIVMAIVAVIIGIVVGAIAGVITCLVGGPAVATGAVTAIVVGGAVYWFTR